MTPGAATHPETEPRHSIAVVARRTGLSQLVLRAWERRYQAVVPGRTETGRRRYSDLDIERLTLLQALTAADHRIGDVAGLPLGDLRKLASELPSPRPARVGASPVKDPSAPGAEALLAQALAAVAALDAAGLEDVLVRAAMHLSRPVLRQELIQPLLEQVGDLWRQGGLRIAHEHMASTIVHAFLASANANQAPAPGSPVLVVAAPLRNRHELGALLAASLALDLGWDVLYLGTDLPAEEIAAAVGQRQARAVFLSLIYPVGDPVVASQLELLRRLLGPGVGLLAGGAAAASYAEAIEQAGVFLATAPETFERALTSIIN